MSRARVVTTEPPAALDGSAWCGHRGRYRIRMFLCGRPATRSDQILECGECGQPIAASDLRLLTRQPAEHAGGLVRFDTVGDVTAERRAELARRLEQILSALGDHAGHDGHFQMHRFTYCGCGVRLWRGGPLATAELEIVRDLADAAGAAGPEVA